VHFTLAHFSDLHLGPMKAGYAFGNFKLKRLIGGLSWGLNRRRLHREEVAAAIRSSMLAARPDHICFTGDAVNIGAWPEFPRAATWLSSLGAPDRLSVVPGNHDCYVTVPEEHGLSWFAPWMGGGSNLAFPYTHLRRNVAVIGLNSGLPQSLFKAAGRVGAEQRRDLGHHLQRLSSQGFCRVVMIHHPPLPGLAKARKALDDAQDLRAVLQENGCELVLHGHNHHFMHNTLETKSGIAHVIGAPSASMAPRGHHEAAGWNEFRIKRARGTWQIELVRHTWQPDAGSVEATKPALLSPA
jgi:3',5'-cyclic AMP phosphodiesterase CpdA